MALRAHRPLLLSLGCAGVVLGVVLERAAALARAAPTDFDDAFAFYRYAGNLLAGRGLVWNPGGPRVFGVTGLGHLVAVTLARLVRPHAGDAALLRACSAGAALAGLLVLALACARLARHPGLCGRPLRFAAVLLPAVVYGEAFFFHTASGMDTMSAFLGNALLGGATLALFERPSRRTAAWAALAGWGAILARPDNALYAALGPPLALTLAEPSPHPRRPAALVFAGLFGALLALDLVGKRVLLGSALPLSFAAKRPGAYAGFAGAYGWNPFWFLAIFLAAALPFWATLVVLAERRHLRRVAVLLLPVVPTFVFLSLGTTQIMGHLGRFYFPALPFFVLAAAGVLDDRLVRFARSDRPRGAPLGAGLRLGVCALLVVVGGRALERAGGAWEARGAALTLSDRGGYRVPAERPLPDRDSWQSSIEMAELCRRAPAGTRVALSEHGLVGARAPEAILIDVLGLHDRRFSGRFSARTLLLLEPDLVWLPHPDHTAMIRQLLDADAFWADYDFYPDALTYGVALRRQGPRAAALRALFAERWRADYPGAPIERYRAER